MSNALNDPMGQAIIDFANTGIDQEIIVSSDLCDDDVISSAYLHRSYNDMPKIEQLALEQCRGKILDVGAGAGSHAQHLMENGASVLCIDTSPLSVSYMKQENIHAECINFFNFDPTEKFDTLLMLMNGIGIAGKLSNLEYTLIKANRLLSTGGKLICDSTDVSYIYEDDEGGMWVDLNTEYYGNFNFQMSYKKHTSEWFNWLYVDFNKLEEIGEKAGFSVTKLFENDNHYLAELMKK